MLRAPAVFSLAMALAHCAELAPVRVIDASTDTTTTTDASTDTASDVMNDVLADVEVPDAATDWHDALVASFPAEVTAAVVNGGGVPSLDCRGTWDFSDAPSNDTIFLTFRRGDGADQFRYFPFGVMPAASSCAGAECRALSFSPDTATVSTSQMTHKPFGYLVTPSSTDYVTTQWSMLDITSLGLAPGVTAYDYGLVPATASAWYATSQTRFGGTVDPNAPIVTVFFLDCAGGFAIGNAVLRLIRENGTPLGFGIAGNTWAGVRYPTSLFGDGAEATTTASNASGTMQAGAIPLSDIEDGELYTLEVWGRLADNAEPSLLGCEQMRLIPRSSNILVLRPLRRGAPSTCID